MITQINIVKEPEYYYPAGLAEKNGLMTYQESQKLSSIPTPSNIVTKSSTAGLLKNDGTVDSNSYATTASVSAITDGQSLDSFSDVETALNGKMNNTYLEESVTLSTSATTTVTFTDNSILTTSVIDIAVSVWGLTPEDVTVSTGACTVIMPKVSTAQTIAVRIYVR